MTRRIALAGWFGSDNLGDELILKSLIQSLRARGAEPVVISIDSGRTRRDHAVTAVTHRNPGQSPTLRQTLSDVDGMAVAGGIIQSETSPWNIPFHTSRLRAGARTGCAMAAVGMGVGHVHGPIGRSLSRSSLGRFDRIVVRDTESARRLHHWGLDNAVVGTDPAVALEAPPVDPDDTMCVILRPPNRRGPRTAAGKAKKAGQATALDGIARAIDEAAAATGLTPRFVAFQASRDGPLHDQVAGRLSASPEVVAPTLDTVFAEVARSRLVVTMRYHGAIVALLHDRPAVMVDSSPKMASLAAEGEGWAPRLGLAHFEGGRLASAATEALGAHTRRAEARGALTERLAVNDVALDALAGNVQ